MSEASAKIRACLLGGAIGDGIGWPVEFSDQSSLDAQFPDGMRAPDELFPTDDTQMTMFSVQALLAHDLHGGELYNVAFTAYRDWLHTQNLAATPGTSPYLERVPGWLLRQPELFVQRGPGQTCLQSLRSGEPGHDRKGCGTVMRTAPAGLAGLADPYDAGWQLSAPTHGHPTGRVAGGAWSWLIAAVFAGETIQDASEALLRYLRDAPEAAQTAETADALDNALTLHARGILPSRTTTPKLGGGWIAEECLAIGVYCALAAPDFATGVLWAADHAGDSDSTAALTGQLLGLRDGLSGIPDEWLRRLTLKDIVLRAADDLALLVTGEAGDAGVREKLLRRYPN